jgi:hypothetical protein
MEGKYTALWRCGRSMTRGATFVSMEARVDSALHFGQVFEVVDTV